MARQPKKEPRVSVTRRIDAELWRRVEEYAASFPLRVTDTAVIEAALTEYLDRHEPKTKKGEKQ